MTGPDDRSAPRDYAMTARATCSRRRSTDVQAHGPVHRPSSPSGPPRSGSQDTVGALARAQHPRRTRRRLQEGRAGRLIVREVVVHHDRVSIPHRGERASKASAKMVNQRRRGREAVDGEVAGRRSTTTTRKPTSAANSQVDGASSPAPRTTSLRRLGTAHRRKSQIDGGSRGFRIRCIEPARVPCSRHVVSFATEITLSPRIVTIKRIPHPASRTTTIRATEKRLPPLEPLRLPRTRLRQLPTHSHLPLAPRPQVPGATESALAAIAAELRLSRADHRKRTTSSNVLLETAAADVCRPCGRLGDASLALRDDKPSGTDAGGEPTRFPMCGSGTKSRDWRVSSKVSSRKSKLARLRRRARTCPRRLSQSASFGSVRQAGTHAGHRPRISEMALHLSWLVYHPWCGFEYGLT